MSQHHRAQKWTTHSPKLREKHAAMLPQPCIRCGRIIVKGESFHVGHRTPAALGGKPTMQNTGPIHARCNLIEGGQLGAAMTNGRRKAANGIRAW